MYVNRESDWRFPNFRKYCRPFPTPRAEFQKLRWLGFPLTLGVAYKIKNGVFTCSKMKIAKQ